MIPRKTDLKQSESIFYSCLGHVHFRTFAPDLLCFITLKGFPRYYFEDWKKCSSNVKDFKIKRARWFLYLKWNFFNGRNKSKEKGRRVGERKGENSAELGSAKLEVYVHTKNWTSQGVELVTTKMDLLWSSGVPTPMQCPSLQTVCCPETHHPGLRQSTGVQPAVCWMWWKDVLKQRSVLTCTEEQ